MPLKRHKRAFLFGSVFVIFLCICLSVTGMYIYYKSSMERAQMEQVVLSYSNKVNNVLTKMLYKTQVLAAMVVQNDGSIDDFEKVAALVLDDPAIKNVLIAPNGIVSQVYPLEENEAVIGLNFFEKGQGNPEAIAARDSGQLVLGGPFDLIQGGQALVGRLPVYTKNEAGEKIFWGLVSVTLYYPQALEEANLDQLQNQGFAFEIWRVSPDTEERQIIAWSHYDYDRNARFVEQDLDILNADWKFRLSPVKNWTAYPETWILTIGSIFISFLASFFALTTYNLKNMKNELEVLTLTDPLTGVLNRRGMFSALNELMRQPDCKLTLCYMDLNKFKYINDAFGHDLGDKILQQFSELFSKHTDNHHLLARIGGDEFIFVFHGTEDSAEINAFLDTIQQELDALSLGSCLGDMHISFSVGQASYPSECQSIDELLRHADQHMYKNKTQRSPCNTDNG